MHMQTRLQKMSSVEVLARTLYGEARGEYPQKSGVCVLQKEAAQWDKRVGLVAVGNVVMNRFQQQTWYGKSIHEVCLKPYQFSCWNEGDPNRSKILTVGEDTSVFKVCLEVAAALVNMMCPDVTYGSDHYHSILMRMPPTWTRAADEKVQIGRHRFYKMRVQRNV